MKIKTYLLATLMLFSLSFNYAQKDSIALVKLPRYEVKLSILGSGGLVFNPSDEYWEKATPGFTIPDSMYPNNYFHHGNGGGSPAILFSFSVINNVKKMQKFRTSTTFHIGIGQRMSAFKNWNHSEVRIIDTLQSLQTGNTFYVEETKETSIQKSFYSNSLALGVGQRISTNPHRVFKFETGLEALFLIGLQSRVSVGTSESYYVNNGYGSIYYPNSSSSGTYQQFRAKSMAGMVVRLPLDFSFRLSNRRRVAKDMRIGWELNPGINLLFQKGASLSNNYTISGGMNFRYQF